MWYLRMMILIIPQNFSAKINILHQISPRKRMENEFFFHLFSCMSHVLTQHGPNFAAVIKHQRL